MVDIETALIVFLRNRLNVPVHDDVPKDRPKRFVTIERTGGGKDNIVIDRPVVAVQSWAENRLEAMKLAMQVDEIMPEFVTIQDVSRVTRNSLYNFPGSNGEPRAQSVYDIVTL